LGEPRNFLQSAILAKSARLFAGAAKFKSDQIVIKMDVFLDVGDLAAKVAGTKNVSGRSDSRRRRFQRCPRCLREGSWDNQHHQADHNYSACGALEWS
jgi:hypothetical protein